MTMGKGTDGSKKRRPKKNGATKLKAKNPKMQKGVAKAIAKNRKKRKKEWQNQDCTQTFIKNVKE